MPPARFGRSGRGVCGVKVKLTMWLAARRKQVGSAHSITSKASLQGGLWADHRVAANRFGHRAGRGGDPSAKDRSSEREGFSGPPFFFSHAGSPSVGCLTYGAPVSSALTAKQGPCEPLAGGPLALGVATAGHDDRKGGLSGRKCAGAVLFPQPLRPARFRGKTVLRPLAEPMFASGMSCPKKSKREMS